MTVLRFSELKRYVLLSCGTEKPHIRNSHYDSFNGTDIFSCLHSISKMSGFLQFVSMLDSEPAAPSFRDVLLAERT